MALTYKRVNAAGTGGGSSPGSDAFQKVFSTANWVLQSGEYQLSILESEHDVGDKPTVQVYDEVGANFEQVGVKIRINSTGDVLLIVNEIPDLRFDGKVIIS